MSAVERRGNGGSGVLRLGLPVSIVAGGLMKKASVLWGLWRFNGGVGGRMGAGGMARSGAVVGRCAGLRSGGRCIKKGVELDRVSRWRMRNSGGRFLGWRDRVVALRWGFQRPCFW